LREELKKPMYKDAEMDYLKKVVEKKVSYVFLGVKMSLYQQYKKSEM
jgi:hypothetical protein